MTNSSAGGLTESQFEILAALIQGYTPKEIAMRRGITKTTVNAHLLNARRRLHARTNVQAAAILTRESVSPLLSLLPSTNVTAAGVAVQNFYQEINA